MTFNKFYPCVAATSIEQLTFSTFLRCAFSFFSHFLELRTKPLDVNFRLNRTLSICFWLLPPLPMMAVRVWLFCVLRSYNCERRRRDTQQGEGGAVVSTVSKHTRVWYVPQQRGGTNAAQQMVGASHTTKGIALCTVVSVGS